MKIKIFKITSFFNSNYLKNFIFLKNRIIYFPIF